MIDIPHDPTLTIQPSYAYPPGDLTLKCGNGHPASISRPDHMVDAAGIVTPSLVCPWVGDQEENCDWHETVRLLDWPPPHRVQPEKAGPGGLV